MTVPSDLPLGHAKPCPTCGTCPTCGHRPQPFQTQPYWWWQEPQQQWWLKHPTITYQAGFGVTTSKTSDVST